MIKRVSDLQHSLQKISHALGISITLACSLVVGSHAPNEISRVPYEVILLS